MPSDHEPTVKTGIVSDGLAVLRLRRRTRKIAHSAADVMKPEMITDARGKLESDVLIR